MSSPSGYFFCMYIVLWIAVSLAVGFYICQPVMDPDLWWHIVVGRWILAHGYPPSFDYWNLFANGKPWVAYSWSNEIIYAFTELKFGIEGLAVLKLLLAALLSVSLFWTFSKVAKDWFFGALLGIFATTACHNHFVLRPQSFIWILFAYLIYLITIADREGWDRRKLIVLFVIFSLWANTHITTIIGLGTLFLWNLNSFNLRKIALPLVVAFLGTLATPYFGKEWIIFFTKSSHPLQLTSIAEFSPASIMQFATGFLLISITALLCFVHKKPAQIGFGRTVFLAGLTLSALGVVKFLPMAVIAICFSIADFWASSENSKQDLGSFAEGLVRFREFVATIPKEGLCFVFLVIAFINVLDVIRTPLDLTKTPKNSVDFIIEKQLPDPILNEFGRGGYLIYRFSQLNGNPTKLVAIDGRTNVVPHDVMTKFMNAFTGKANWHEYLDLVNPQTILWRNDSPLISILKNGNEWCRIYQEGSDEFGYSVLVKNSWVAKHKDFKCN
ncbi:MAG: hypothetical protein KDD56_07770 [Bdellovibrionales bacterium]|nr:hypothetical protein [Bdellovibrionales bacterium]